MRSHMGLFLAFQYPVAIPGVTVANFLRTAINARRKAENTEDKGIPIPEFRKLVEREDGSAQNGSCFAGRYLNEGFSGGEKKRAEVLQMAALRPEIAVMDETDSGLDIDALRIVSEGVNTLRGPDLGVLVITHYQRILNYIKPDYVQSCWMAGSWKLAAQTWPCTWKSMVTIGCAREKAKAWQLNLKASIAPAGKRFHRCKLDS